MVNQYQKDKKNPKEMSTRGNDSSANMSLLDEHPSLLGTRKVLIQREPQKPPKEAQRIIELVNNGLEDFKKASAVTERTLSKTPKPTEAKKSPSTNVMRFQHNKISS